MRGGTGGRGGPLPPAMAAIGSSGGGGGWERKLARESRSRVTSQMDARIRNAVPNEVIRSSRSGSNLRPRAPSIPASSSAQPASA